MCAFTGKRFDVEQLHESVTSETGDRAERTRYFCSHKILMAEVRST